VLWLPWYPFAPWRWNDAETARVSLDCFCSVYGCSSYEDLSADCRVPHYSRPSRSVRAREACGQVWYDSRRVSGPGTAFDPASGSLVAAEVSSLAPVTTEGLVCALTRANMALRRDPLMAGQLRVAV